MAKLHLFPQIARKLPLEIVKAAEEKYKSNKGCQYLDFNLISRSWGLKELHLETL